MSNERYLQAWKASPGYAGDLEIVKKAYAGNARYLDQQILEPMFNLYGNAGLKRDTVVVFAGDHGEMHMERDQLTHATSGFDEAVEIPAAVRFPRDWPTGIHVKEQTPLHRIAELTEGVLAGSIHRENLSEKIQSLTDDVVILRDCRNTIRGLRFKNKYKYLVDTASGERQLFDLESDPDELVNVALSRSETTDEMEALYWTHLPKYNWIPPYRCLPW